MAKGANPTQAAPSQRSNSNCGGTSGRTAAGAKGQCRNVRSRHTWRMAGLNMRVGAVAEIASMELPPV
jgi:hypothetical protein